MTDALGFGATGAPTRDRSLTLFGQTMFHVAVTAACFALGSHLGRDLSSKSGWVWFIAALGCLIVMNFTVRRSTAITAVLLLAFGLLIGLALAPTLV